MTEGELKPCPFCGGKARADNKDLFRRFYVTCGTCKTTSGTHLTPMAAITAWNTRTRKD